MCAVYCIMGVNQEVVPGPVGKLHREERGCPFLDSNADQSTPAWGGGYVHCLADER